MVFPSLTVRIIFALLRYHFAWSSTERKGGNQKRRQGSLPPYWRFRGTFLPFRFPPLYPPSLFPLLPTKPQLKCGDFSLRGLVLSGDKTSVLGVLVDSGLAFIASTREHPASQALGWFMGLLGVVVFLFYFSFFVSCFCYHCLAPRSRQKSFKQRCDAYWCRVFPACYIIKNSLIRYLQIS